MDHLKRSLLNTFVVRDIDHVSTHRSDESWIEQQLARSPLIFAVWRGSFLVLTSAQIDAVELVELSRDEVGEISGFVDTLFLGQLQNHGSRPVFAALIDNQVDDVDQALSDRGEFIDLRKAGAILQSQQAALVAHAKALEEWHSRNRFCPRCASPMKSVSAGHVLRCQSDSCGRDQFPRLDPAIIVRVNIDDRILLGRQASWAPSQYSVIAGFAEPGESLEQSVAREVFEETGIEVAEVHYQSSQPWPFPGNIMLGYAAVASHDRIQPNDEELEDARWFTRQQIVEQLEAHTLRVPPSVSISMRLIEDWFDQGDNGRLADIIERTGASWVPPPVTS